MADESYLTDIPIGRFGLVEPLQRGIEDAGFQYCTHIQAQALPLALEGKDVAGQAQTGTGKTAAFLLAAMQYLLTRPPAPNHEAGDPRVLILAPTRELAVQIARDASVLARHTGLRVVVVYGGEGYEQQREALRQGVDILVGTPGRIIDYFRQQVFSLKSAQVLVLDEADRMFDLGFLKDIRFLLRRLPHPEHRLNMLFSATLSYRVMELAYEHMNNPTIVNVAPADRITAENVTQTLYHVAVEEKMAVLVGLLRHMDAKRSLVFTNTRRVADRVRDMLVGNGFDAEVLSGDVPQSKRLKLLGRFSSGDLPILVATDVAARGLHIPDVSHVFNFDLPQDAQDYVHRIGRTARAGASGDAVSLACDEYVFSLPEIEEFIGHKLPVAPVTDDLLVKLQPAVRSERRPRLGRPGEGRRPGRPGPGSRGGRERPAAARRPFRAVEATAASEKPAPDQSGEATAPTAPQSPPSGRRSRRRPAQAVEGGQTSPVAGGEGAGPAPVEGRLAQTPAGEGGAEAPLKSRRRRRRRARKPDSASSEHTP
jgi:ATP-dependent RNA helicase RhlB